MMFMAMTHEQRAAFETAAGDTVAGYSYLWLGAIFVFLCLWASWAALVAYKGWCTHNLSNGQFGGAMVRLLIIYLITAAFFLI